MNNIFIAFLQIAAAMASGRHLLQNTAATASSGSVINFLSGKIDYSIGTLTLNSDQLQIDSNLLNLTTLFLENSPGDGGVVSLLGAHVMPSWSSKSSLDIILPEISRAAAIQHSGVPGGDGSALYVRYSTNDALQLEEIADDMSPFPIFSHLDLTKGVLTLGFSEIVSTPLVVTAKMAMAPTGTKGNVFELTGAQVSVKGNLFVEVEIILTETQRKDAAYMSQQSGLKIRVQAGAVTDLAQNKNEAADNVHVEVTSSTIATGDDDTQGGLASTTTSPNDSMHDETPIVPPVTDADDSETTSTSTTTTNADGSTNVNTPIADGTAAGVGGSTTTPSSSSDGSTTTPKTNADGTPFVPPVNNGTPACMNIIGTQATTTPCICGTAGLHGEIAQTCAIGTFCYWDGTFNGACLNNAKVPQPATANRSGSSYCGPGTKFDGTHCVASYEAMLNSCKDARKEWGFTCGTLAESCNDAAN